MTAPTLLDLLQAYEQTRDAFEITPACSAFNSKLESDRLAANDALKEAVEQSGANATTLAEAKAATRLAAREWNDDDSLCAALAMAALAYFVGDPFEDAI